MIAQRNALSIVMLVMMSSCASVSHAPLPAPQTQSYAPGGDASSFAAADGVTQSLAPAADDDRWWTAFGSDKLNRLVDEALAGNPDLAAARASLTAANETYKAQRASLWPHLGFSYTGQKARNPDNLASPLAGDSPDNPYVLHTAQLTINYTPDLFGGIRASVRGAKAGVDLAAWQWQGARTLLVSNLVVAVITRASLEEQAVAADAAANASRDMLHDMQASRQMGNASEADVAPYIAQLAQDEQTAAQTRHALMAEETVLKQLLGREPAQDADIDISLSDLHLPDVLPYRVPADLVRHRPDVAEARAQLAAAAAAADEADAARWPSLDLSALGGGSASRLADLSRKDNSFWNLQLGLTAPLTDSIALAHQAHAAKAQWQAAQATYRSAVLHALTDAATTLDVLNTDSALVAEALQTDMAAAVATGNLQRQEASGDVGHFQVLNAQRSAAQARAALSAARLQRLSDTVALYVAMGGPIASDKAAS